MISLVPDHDCTSGSKTHGPLQQAPSPTGQRMGSGTQPRFSGHDHDLSFPIQGQGIPQALISGWFLENDRFFFFSF